MKCTYRFPVDGRLKVGTVAPLEADHFTFEFELEGAIVRAITVTVEVRQREHWPRLLPSREPGGPPGVETTAPFYPFIQHHLVTLQGILSYFGVRSINWQAVDVRWTPETDEEKAALPIQSYKRELGDVDPKIGPVLNFDVLARCIFAAVNADDVAELLDFFRRGLKEMWDEQYVEAIRNFYLLIESLYGKGNFKKARMEQDLASSAELRKCIEAALADADLIPSRHRRSFERRFARQSVEEAISHFVDLAGRLRHHSIGRTMGSWHPAVQWEHELDALVLQSVAFRIASEIIFREIHSEDVIGSWKSFVEGRRRAGGA